MNTSLSLASPATQESFSTHRDRARAFLVKKGIKDVEQALEVVMLDAIDRTTKKVNIMSILTCKPSIPLVVSAELYARELLTMFWYRFRVTYNPKEELEPSSSKPKPLDKADWFNEPLSPEHGKWLRESKQKAEAMEEQPKPPVAQPNLGIKEEVSSSAKKARGSQPLVSRAMAPPPTCRTEPAQAPAQEAPAQEAPAQEAPAQEAPATSQPSPQNGSERRPSGAGYSIPCFHLDRKLTLQVWKDHLKPLTGIHGSGLAWHVVIPAAKSHLFFGEKGSQINQVVESCTPPAHITAKITKINGDEVLLIAIYAKASLFGNPRDDESRMVDGLEVAMLQMFDAIYTWSTKIHGGEDLSFVDFMESRKQRLIREAVNATISTVAKAAHDLSVRTSQAMQDDVEQQERTKRRRLDG